MKSIKIDTSIDPWKKTLNNVGRQVEDQIWGQTSDKIRNPIFNQNRFWRQIIETKNN
jgi:hypothetical protein